MARHVIHFRPAKGFVVCGADCQRRTWGVIRDVDSVPTMEHWDALSDAQRCTRCAAKVAKMKDVNARRVAREAARTPVAATPLPAPLQRLRDRHERLHANDGTSAGLLF